MAKVELRQDPNTAVLIAVAGLFIFGLLMMAWAIRRGSPAMPYASAVEPKQVGPTERSAVSPRAQAAPPAQPNEPPPIPPADKIGRPTITQGPPREWQPKGLYVGDIRVMTDQLAAELVIQILIVGFNATNRNLKVEHSGGHIVFKERSQDPEEKRIPLPSPRICYEKMNKQTIENLSQIFFTIEQRFPREATGAFLKSFEAGNKVYLDFKLLELTVSAHGKPSDTMRLPLWHGVIVYKGEDRPMTGKVAEASAHAGV
jgi:hypothetical protein